MKNLLLFLLLCNNNLFAATFYVSATGNDSQNGLSINTPWRSISKLNQGNFNVGDIILFKRGDIFRGALDVPKSGCQFGAYGVGANPVISGAVALSNWTLHNGNIYKANLAGAKIPSHLYLNNKLMTIARFPNTGWLKNGTSNDKKTLNSSVLASLGKPSNYWNGASVHVRSFSWLFDNRIVNSSNGGTIIMNNDLSETASNIVNPGWGFYLDNKLSELDAPGEWFFDPTTKVVYFYAPNGASPSTQLVEVSVEDFGIKIFFQNNTKIENLSITMTKDQGIQPWLSDGVTINNCVIENIGSVGIQQPWNCKDLKITNNIIRNCLNYGIFWNEDGGFDNGANLIQGNKISSIGMVAGYGGSGVVQYCGVRTRGRNTNFIKNTIDSAGYVCMLSEGSNSIIEKNVFKNSQLLLDDGGALFINSSNNTIRNNFFLNSFGNRDESSGLFNGSSFRIMGMGIFSQPGFSGSIIENNVFANNRDYGLYLDNHANATVKNNLMFNNKVQMSLTNNGGTKGNITGNTLYSLLPTQIALKMENAPLDYANVFNNAFYGNAYNASNLINANNTNYTFSAWRSAFPTADAAAATSTVNFTYVDSLTAISRHLFLTNPSDVAINVSLGSKTYRQLNGTYVCGNTVTVAPWSAKLLLMDDESEVPIYTTATALAVTLPNVDACKWYNVKVLNQNLVSVSPNGSNLGTVTVNTYLNPSNPVVLGSRSLGRNWVVTATTAPSTSIKTRLFFTLAEFNALKTLDATINTVNDLKVIKYSGANEDNIFTNNSGAPATSILGTTFMAYQNGFYAEFEANGLSEFWIVSKITGPLPITLTNFTATPQQNYIRLNWQTSQEKNSSRFEIERKIDDINFSKIETVDASKNTTSLQTYSFIDKDIAGINGNIYYRLKMVDNDGSFEYSETKAVKLDFISPLEVKIYPNPAVNTLTIELIKEQSGSINYVISNSIGAVELKGKYEHSNVKSHQGFDISSLTTGIYFIKIVGIDFQKTLKFIKL